MLHKNESEPHFKESLLPHISFVPQQIRTQQVQAVRQTTTAKSAHRYQASLTEQAVVKKQHGIEYRHSELLPKFSEQGDNMSWYQTPEMALRRLLGLARSNEDCRILTQKDIEFIVYCCNYTGLMRITPPYKLAKLAIRILSYLAQNQWQLPDSALDALAIKLQEHYNGDANPKTLDITLLALAHAFLNGQKLLPAVKKNLNVVARRFIEKHKSQVDAFSSMAVMFAVCAMLNSKLSDSELNVLKNILMVPAIEGQFISIPKNINLGYAPPISRPPWLNWVQVFEIYFLKHIKHKSYSNKLLTEAELRYTTHQWEGADIRDRATASDIVKRALMNKQRSFPEQQAALTCLQRALTDGERKIKNNAILAISILLRHSEVKNRYDSDRFNQLISKIRVSFDEALKYQRKYALLALNQHIEKQRHTAIPHLAEWTFILEQLQQNADVEVRNSARFTLFHIKNDLNSLEELLLDFSCHVEVSKNFCDAVQQLKRELSKNAIDKLGKLLAEPKYRIEAKVNAAITLGCAVENGQILSPNIIKIIIDKAASSLDARLCNAAFTALGNIALSDISNLYVANLLQHMARALAEKEKANAASFLLANFLAKIERSERDYSRDAYFSGCFNKASIILADSTSEAETKKNCALALAHAAQKKFTLQASIFENLAQGLIEPKSESVRGLVLMTIGYALENAASIQWPDKIANKVVEAILIILFGQQEKLRDDAVRVLKNYIKKTNRILPHAVTEKIIDLIKDTHAALMGCEIIKDIAEKKWEFSNLAIEKIVGHLIHQYPEIRLEVSLILGKIAIAQKIPEKLISQIEVAIDDIDENIVGNVLLTLQQIFKKSSSTSLIRLTQKTCYQLVQIANGYNDKKNQLYALSILASVSERGLKLSMEEWDLLTRIAADFTYENNELRNLAVHVLACQVRYMVIAIKNNNIQIQQIFLVLEKNLNVIAPMPQLLLALKQASDAGYQISSDGLNTFAEVLLVNADKEVIEKAYFIIEKAKNLQSASDKAKRILELEQCSHILINPIISEFKCKEATQRLLCIALEMHELTQNNLHILESILQNSLQRSFLYEDALKIFHQVAKNGQQLPNTLLNLLKNFVKNNFISSDFQRYAALILAETAKYHFISNEMFVAIESIFGNRNEILEEYLIALEIAVKRNLILQTKTITKITALLEHEKFEIRQIAANIVSKLPGSKLNLEFLIEKLNVCADILIQKELITAIKNIVFQENKALSYQELSQLFNILKQNKFSEIEKKMVSLFNLIESKQKLPVKIKDLIYFKQQENLFLQENCNIEIQLQALAIMQKNADFLTLATLKKLEKLLLSSTDTAVIDAIIKLIVVAQEKMILPQEIYEALVVYIAKISVNENALFVLKQAIVLKKEISGVAIESLKEILITHPNNILRKFVYDSLSQIKQYQKINSTTEELLYLEPSLSEIPTKKFLKDHLEKLCVAVSKKCNKEFILSLNNMLLLMQALQQGNAKLIVLSVNIIENIYPFIKQDFYPIIFHRLVQSFSNVLDKQKHIFKICDGLMQTYSFSETMLQESFSTLISSIKLEEVSINALSLLHSISKQHTIVISKPQFDVLVAILVTNPDSELQIKAIQILTSLLIGNRKNCSLYFENINQFLQIIAEINKANDSSVGTDTPTSWNSVYSIIQHIGEIVGLNSSLQHIKEIVGLNSPHQISYIPKVQKELCYLLSYLYGMGYEVKETNASIVSILNKYLSSSIGISTEIMQQLRQCTDAQKINLMLTISASDFYEDFLILKSNSPTAYVRNLLCHELFMRYETIRDSENNEDIADEEYRKFYLLLSSLEESQQWGHGYNEERDNFLRALLIKQKNECLSLYKINQLLSIAAKSFQSAELTFMNKTCEMKIGWIKRLFESYQWQVTESDVKEIERFIEILAWDPEIVDEFLETCNQAKNTKELKSLLRLMSDHPLDAAKVVEDFIDIELNKNNESIIATFKKEFIQGLLLEAIVPIFEKYNYRDDPLNLELNDKKQKCLSLLMQCVNAGWSFETLCQWLHSITDQVKNNGLKGDSLLEILDMICAYQLSEHEFYSRCKEETLEELPNKLHQIYIRKTFQFDGEEKDSTMLIHEASKLNENNPQIIQLVDQGQFFTLLNKIDRYYKNIQTLPSTFSLSHTINLKKPICEWECQDIKYWAQHIRNVLKDKQNIQALYPEIFAVLKRACMLHTDYEPRIAQVLAMIVILGAQPNKGRITEIMTGEGKSLIIAMCGVISALQGEKVDIVTSSPILAERDVKDYQNFYDLFNIKVASNTNNNQYTLGLKHCYSSDVDVVYGDAGNFQFDILRDEYSQLGTRGSRGFGTVIVDEVDNLLIDEGAKIAMLASPVPGMDSLHPILILIWQELCFLHQCLSCNEDDKQIHFIRKNAEGHEENEIIAKDQISIFLRTRLEKFIHQVFYKKQDKIIEIPDQLKGFVETQTPKWIQSALLAFYTYEKGVHYKLKKDHQGITSVIPVDFVNTGVAQNGTNWGDGLTQFLQIKHGLKLTSESLITNFLSNIAFIKRYGHKVYGLTGTLGSESSQELLQKIYKVDCAHIPTHKLKQYTEFPGLLLETVAEWKQEIVSSAIREAKQGRVSLVICESMESAEKISKEIALKHKGITKLYVDSDSNQNQFLEETLEGDTIIVATNLAGRGTDIKLDPQVIQKGGLHVCVTFLPNNLRVEHQALGRCARKGEPGTTQMVLNVAQVKTKLDSLYNATELTSTDKIKRIKEWRDKNESARLARVKQHDLPQTENKDELFQKFCTLLKELDAIDSEENSLQNKFLNFVCDPSSSFLKCFSDKEIQYKRLAVEERWGLWLKKNNIENNASKANALFTLFKTKVLEDYKNNNIIDNPCHYLAKGNYFLLRSNSLAEKLWSNALCKMAIADYDRAIALNSEQAYIAYYNKAYALIKIAEDNNYKEEAKKLLHKAQNILIDKLIPLQQSLSLNIQNIKKKNVIFEKELSQYLTQKCQLLELFQQSIAKAIKEIEGSQKLLDIEYCNAVEILQYQRLNDQEAAKVLWQNQKNLGTYTVSFHDLKAHNNDMIADHQSINTIFQASCDGNINIIFYSDTLSQQNDTNKSLAKLLPINRRPPKNKEKKHTVNKTKPQEQQQDHKERVGFLEHLEYGAGVVKSGISHAADKVSNFATQATAPISEKWLNFQDWFYENKKAELVPVTLTLTNLDLDKITCILKQIEGMDRRITLEFSGINNELLEFFAQSFYAKRIYVVTDSQITQEGLYGCKKTYISITQPLSHLKATKDINNQLCFKQLFGYEVKEIVHLLNERVKEDTVLKLKINIQLIINGVPQKNADAILNNLTHEQATLTFSDLDKANAVRIIYLTEKEHDNAVFQIKYLSKQQAEHLIKVADRKQQNFNVHTHLFETEFLKINPNKTELQEYKNSGHIYFYDIQEKNPLPWRAMILVGAIAALQIAGGIALTITTGGFAASVGLGLVADSFSEIMRLISTAQSRDFNLSAYLCQKAISIAMILATAGLSVGQAKEAGKAVDTIAYVVENYTDEVAISAAQMLTTTARSTSVSVATNATNKALQQLTMNLVERGVSQSLNVVLDGVSNFALEQAQSSISECVNAELRQKFADVYWQKLLYRIFAIDKYLEGTKFQGDICKNVENLVSNMNFDVLGYNVLDIHALTKFEKDFSDILHKVEGELPNFQEILKRKLVVSAEEAKKICTYLKAQKILMEDDTSINMSPLFKHKLLDKENILDYDQLLADESIHDLNLDHINLHEFNHIKKGIIEICSTYYITMKDEYFLEKNSLRERISSFFVKQINETLKTVSQVAKDIANKLAADAVHNSLQPSSPTHRNEEQTSENQVRHGRRRGRKKFDKDEWTRRQKENTRLRETVGQTTNASDALKVQTVIVNSEAKVEVIEINKSSFFVKDEDEKFEKYEKYWNNSRHKKDKFIPQNGSSNQARHYVRPTDAASNPSIGKDTNIVLNKSAIDDYKQHFPNTDKTRVHIHDNNPILLGENNSYRGRNNHHERWQKLTANQPPNDGFKFADAQNRNWPVVLSTHNHRGHLDVLLHNHRIHSDIDERTKNFLVNHSLTAIRETIVLEIKETDKKNTKKEIERMQKIVDSSSKDFTEQSHNFLVEIKSTINKIIALILVDKKTMSVLNSLAISNTNSQEAFTLDEIKNEAKSIHDICFYLLEHEERYEYLIKYLDKKFLGNHTDIEELLCEAKKLFATYHEQLLRKNSIPQKDLTSKISSSNQKPTIDIRPIHNSAHLVFTLTSSTASSISSILIDREKNKQKIMAVKANAVNALTSDINNLSRHLSILSQSQNELTKAALNGFMRIFQKLSNVTPQKLEEIRQQKRQERKIDELIKKLEKSENFAKENPCDQQYTNECNRLIEEIEQAEDIIEQEQKIYCQQYIVQVKQAREVFTEHMKELNLSDNFTITQTIELQRKMIFMVEEVLDNSKNNVSLDNSSNLSQAKNETKLSTQAKIQLPGNFGIFAPPKNIERKNNAAIPVIARVTKTSTSSNSQSAQHTVGLNPSYN